MHFVSTKIRNAVAEIKERGLNTFRCYLTGSPYATISDEEIEIALESEVLANGNVASERLVDMWEMRVISISQQRLPSLRGITEYALVPHLHRGKNGNVRISTYMLTRLFFPKLGADMLSSDEAMTRARFSRTLHDWLAEADSAFVSNLAQQLAAIDSYCAMPLWHTLWAFDSAHSKLGIDKAPINTRAAFADPESIFDSADYKAIIEVIDYLFQLMLFITERDGVAGKSGSKLAQRILLIQGEELHVAGIPLHQKREVSEADRLRIEQKKAINSRNELRIAHSAIHGPKKLPGGRPIDPIEAMAKQMMEGLKKSKPSQKSKPKKEPAKTDSVMANIFATAAASFTFKV